MTSEEIKQYYSMREIAERYGIRIKRDGMCSCPFHGADRHASMKIYKDSFHCFACGANGDLFSFIQRMDNCDFKTAFISLGGDYEQLSEEAREAAKNKREHERLVRERNAKREEDFKRELSEVITLAQTSIHEDAPLSDRWCVSQNYIELFLYYWEQKYLYGEGVSIPGVYRICQRFRCKYDSANGSNDGAVFD